VNPIVAADKVRLFPLMRVAASELPAYVHLLIVLYLSSHVVSDTTSTNHILLEKLSLHG
jgi:hypothetical protein